MSVSSCIHRSWLTIADALRSIARHLNGALVAAIALSLIAPGRGFAQTQTSGLITGTIRDLATRHPLGQCDGTIRHVDVNVTIRKRQR